MGQGDKRGEFKVGSDGKMQAEMSDWVNSKGPRLAFPWVGAGRVEDARAWVHFRSWSDEAGENSVGS